MRKEKLPSAENRRSGREHRGPRSREEGRHDGHSSRGRDLDRDGSLTWPPPDGVEGATPPSSIAHREYSAYAARVPVRPTVRLCDAGRVSEGANCRITTLFKGELLHPCPGVARPKRTMRSIPRTSSPVLRSVGRSGARSPVPSGLRSRSSSRSTSCLAHRRTRDPHSNFAFSVHLRKVQAAPVRPIGAPNECVTPGFRCSIAADSEGGHVFRDPVDGPDTTEVGR